MADNKESAAPADAKPEEDRGTNPLSRAGSARTQPVAEIIEAFGGLRPMAGKLKVAVSTVQGWKERDSIPTARHDEIQAAAKSHGIALDPAVLSASDHMTRDQTSKTAATGLPGRGVMGKTSESEDRDVKKDESADSAKAKPEAATAAPAGISSQVKTGIPVTGPATGSSTGSPTGSSSGTPGAAGKAAAPAYTGKPVKPADTGPAGKTAGSGARAKDEITAAPQRKSGGWLGGFVLGVVVLAVVLAGAVYSRNLWLPLVESLPVMAGGGSAGLNDRVAELETKLGTLQAPAVDLTSVDDAIAAANERIDVLDETLGELLTEGVILAPGGDNRNAGSVIGPQQLDALRNRVEQLAGQLASLRTGAGSPSSSSTQDAAQGRLSELAGRLDEMERKIAGLPDPAARLTDLDARLSKAEREVAALPDFESRFAAQLAALNEALPKGPSREAGDTAMFLALLQLREALGGSGAFESELSLVSRLAADDADLNTALAPLADRAGSGIASLTSLQASFGEMAGKAVAASRGGEEDDWMSKTLRKLSEVVTIRPVGLVEGADAGAVLARAEVQLGAGDLAAAVAELDGLTGAAAQSAAAWRQEAEARLEAQKALSLIAARAAGLIGLGG
jgi:hypothetical protein